MANGGTSCTAAALTRLMEESVIMQTGTVRIKVKEEVDGKVTNEGDGGNRASYKH